MANRRSVPGLVVIAAVFAGCAGEKPVVKADAQAGELPRIVRDSAKVDKSIEVTRSLIDGSDGEQYLPDLYMRLAELYVEKSRLVFFQVVEEAHADDKSAVQAPEARLWKDEAIAVYRRIIREYPTYPDNDKITFFIGHEYRELGNFPEMKATFEELIAKYPQSSFRFEALLILGDYSFDKNDVDAAIQSYRTILKGPESYAHNIARYKLAWCYINKDKPALAVDLWEQAVKTPTPMEPGAPETVSSLSDRPSRLDVRQDALRDLAYYYAESREPASAIPYFQSLTVSRSEYRLALEKLAKRFEVKTMYAEAAKVYRELIRVSDDVDRNLEWAESVYQAALAAHDLSHADDDVIMLANVSARYRYWWRADEHDKKVLKDFELLARDLATRLHALAQKNNDPVLFARAARAYESFLSAFDDSPELLAIQWNYAEVLFSSQSFVRAGRQYEQLTKAAPPDEQKRALYSAILSYFEALKAAPHGTRFETMVAREGIKDLGGRFVAKYPDDTNTPMVKFNIARAFLEQGQLTKAIELFVAFVKEYPANKDAPHAADLAVDAYARKEDFTGLAALANQLAAMPALPDHDRFAQVAKDAAQRAADHLIIGRDPKKILAFVHDHPGDVAAKTLWSELVIARDKHDWQQMEESARALLNDYPDTPLAKDALPLLAEQALLRSRVDVAAQLFEEYARRYPGDHDADDDLSAAASLREGLGQLDNALADLELLTLHGAEARRPEWLAALAKTAARAGDWPRVESAALAVLDAHPVLGGVLAGEAALRMARPDVANDRLTAAMKASLKPRGDVDGREWIARGQYLLGEIVRADFERVRLGEGGDVGASLQKKIELLDELNADYVAAIDIGDAEWAMGALYRVATADRAAAEALVAAPVPDGLSAADVKTYREALRARAEPLLAQAAQVLDACKKKAKELDAFNRFTKGCNGAAFNDDDDKVRYMAPAAIRERDKIEAKLTTNPKDLAALTELIRAALAAHDYPLAQVLAARAIELDDRTAALHNLQGVALAGENQMQAAAAELKIAINLDPHLSPALANLGAIYAMYGNAERARELMHRAGAFDAGAVDVIPVQRP